MTGPSSLLSQLSPKRRVEKRASAGKSIEKAGCGARRRGQVRFWLRECAIFRARSMIFSRDYVQYLARTTVADLIEAKMIRTDKVAAVNERVNAGLLEELSLEDRINEEVRVILDAYQEEMHRTGAAYAEMFKKVKQELAKKYKAVL
jgi:hypothetical protein